MKIRAFRRSMPGILAAMCALALAVLFVLARPAAAMADEVIAHSVDASGERTEYTSVDAAKTAGYNGATIIMDKEWNLGSASLDLADSKSITIDMNGYRIISANTDATIYLNEHAKLKLISSAQARTFQYLGWSDHYCSWTTFWVTASGFVTNEVEGRNGLTSVAPGIHMEDDSDLTLENIAIAGCGYGGIETKDNCSIDMTNVELCRCRSDKNKGGGDGGGIKLGAYSALNMSASRIHDNVAFAGDGGGIYAEKGVTIDMEDGSTILDNVASDGGGIAFNGTNFTLRSKDKTGSIFRNEGTVGGIHIDSTFGTNEGLIEGLSITHNTSSENAGGIKLGQRWTTLRNCTIVGNSSKEDGGGILVDNSNNTIDNCTITDNYCAYDDGDYEGGGIFVSYKYDIKMTGKCVVKNNTRGKDTGNTDDVFLSTISGQTGFAYITGSLSKGSSVGVRTGIEGDRRVAKSFNPETKNCLFADMDGYYISYGTDEGGDAWQRHSARESTITVDGKEIGTYKQGTLVSVSANPAGGKAFKCWNTDDSTPNVLTDDTKWNQALSFTMPQFDVDLVADYITRTSDVRVTLMKPQPGSELSTEGTLLWTVVDGDETDLHDMSITVAWYKKDKDGTLSPASGTAEEDTTYVANFAVEQDVKKNRAFALDFDTSNVTVSLQGGDELKLGADKASVDESGTLNVATNTYTTPGGTVAEVAPLSVSFPEGTTKADFMEQFPKSVSALTSSGSIVSLKFTQSQDFDSLFDDEGKLKKPEGGSIELGLELDDPEDLVLPETLRFAKCKLTVTDASSSTVDEPTVKADEGKYSIKDEKLNLTASCETEDADIKYSLSRLEKGSWESVSTDKDYIDRIELAAPEGAGAQLNYQLQVWAEKDDSKSAVRTLLYTVENANQPQKVTVTVKYADTAMEGQHGTKADEPYEVVKGKASTVAAPEREGYVFEKWVDASGKVLGTDAVLKLDSIDKDVAVTAVYNPVVSELDVDLSAPVAHQDLAASGTVKAKAGDSDSAFDITSYFVSEDGKAVVAWSPEGDKDGKAEHLASYVAALNFKDDKAASGVKYVISSDVKVKCQGDDVSDGAIIAQDSDGTKRLCVGFPVTAGMEGPVLDALSAVELSHDEALSYQAGQDAGKDETWGLPKEVTATCKCGCTVSLDIEWEKVAGFDKNKLEAQSFTVTGKVLYPSYVDGTGAPETVSVTLNVAAGEEQSKADDAQGGQDGSSRDGADQDDAGQAADDADASDDSADAATPSTGDFALVPVALAALAALTVCLASAVRVRRR